MKIVKKPLSELRKPERNVRIHGDKQIAEFKRSIEMFGQIRPIVIDENGTILAGNGLYEALTALGCKDADCCVMSGLSEKDKKKLMLADNKIFSLGVDDLRAFDAIVKELDEDFDIPGFDADLLKTLTLDFDGADDVMSGYGLISEDAKAEMQQAAEKYEREEREFAESAEEYALSGDSSPSAPLNDDGQAGTLQQAQTPTEDAPTPLQRKFLVCPKCGEKIWL